MGKGGSGKSTLSTLLTKYLSSKGKVLAIDADHNMDLSYNLIPDLKEAPYIGEGLPDLLAYCELPEGLKYPEVFKLNPLPSFQLFGQADSFTKRFSVPISDSKYLMIAGPHTDSILHGQYCSHSLATALKVYLPLLQLKEDEYVVVDEKAGSDGAGAGISTGMHAACIAVEPTRHGIKAATQIAELLEFYETPYVFIGNKILSDEDKILLKNALPKDPIIFLEQSMEMRNLELTSQLEGQFDKLIAVIRSVKKEDRLQRTLQKFERNHSFKENQST